MYQTLVVSIESAVLNKKSPHENFDLRNLRILSVFFKFHGAFKMAEMRSKSGKKLTPHFEHFDGGVFDYFCQNYWSQGHQNLPRVSHQGYLQMLFYKKNF